MSHLSAFDGPLGFVTLHPLLTLGALLIPTLAIMFAARRKPADPYPRRRR